MKITLVSDLHLELGPQIMEGGEVLIIAGDACEASSLYNERITSAGQGPLNQRTPCTSFFLEECPKYEKVFYVLGNHEHYSGIIQKTKERLQPYMPPNVTILENESEVYKGIHFLGTTLWTDCNKEDFVTMQHLKRGMTDFEVIQRIDVDIGMLRPFRPRDSVVMHQEALEFLRNELIDGLPSVVITHHSPSFATTHPRFRDQTLMNGGYCSELSEFILDRPNIKAWCFGHQHDSTDMMIGGTRVVSNPRGYMGYEHKPFVPNFTMEIEP